MASCRHSVATTLPSWLQEAPQPENQATSAAAAAPVVAAAPAMVAVPAASAAAAPVPQAGPKPKLMCRLLNLRTEAKAGQETGATSNEGNQAATQGRTPDSETGCNSAQVPPRVASREFGFPPTVDGSGLHMQRFIRDAFSSATNCFE